MTDGDLRARLYAAIKRLDATEARVKKQRTERNDLLLEALSAGAVTITELVKNTSMSKTQVERLKRGETTGNKRGHAATSGSDA